MESFPQNIPVINRLIRFVASRVRFSFAGFLMTDRTDVARGRDIVARWCGLAEQRLDHLTELFETGRWRRYHSEHDFLENIREAKSAVEVWRGMLSADATLYNRPLDLSWIARRSSVPPVKSEMAAEPESSIVPQLAALPVTAAASVVPEAAISEAAEIEPDSADETFMAVEAVEMPEESALDKALALTLDIVGMAGRYPSLRNAFQQAGTR